MREDLEHILEEVRFLKLEEKLRRQLDKYEAGLLKNKQKKKLELTYDLYLKNLRSETIDYNTFNQNEQEYMTRMTNYYKKETRR